MKITARIARTLTGHRGPTSNMPELVAAVEEGFNEGIAKARRYLTPADVCAERAAMYGPCGDPGCVTCGPRLPAPLPFDPAVGVAVASRREQRRAELDSCEDFGVDPRHI